MANIEKGVVNSIFDDKDGVLTSWIHLTYECGGFQSFGGLAFEFDSHLEKWRRDICEVFRVSKLESIVGFSCYILKSWPGFGDPIEGLRVEGRTFTLTNFRRSLWPNKSWSPLVARASKLAGEAKRYQELAQEKLAELANIQDDYVDWSDST